MNNWDYLDKMDKNLLYIYANRLVKGVNNAQGYFLPICTGNRERDEYDNAERKKSTAYYLIWFVFRYVLGCKTLDEALKYADIDTLNQFKLTPFFLQKKLYIGIYGINHICLRSPEHDITVALEILYNRCDILEQLELYANSGKKKRKYIGLQTLHHTVRLMEDHRNPAFEPMLQKYYARSGGEH